MKFLTFIVFAVIIWYLISFAYVIIPLKIILSVVLAGFFAIWIWERLSHY